MNMQVASPNVLKGNGVHSGRPDARDTLGRYNVAKSLRSPYEEDFRMAAAYCRPKDYGAWQQEGGPGVFASSKAAQRFAYDMTGIRSLKKYVSILERLCVPNSQRWHTLTADNFELMKVYNVRKYFNDVTDKLFKKRYAAKANFTQTTGEMFGSLGIYGTGPIFIGSRKLNQYAKPSMMYKALHMKNVFMLANDEGDVDTIFRRFWLTARQFKQKWPKLEGNQIPAAVRAELMKPTPSDTTYFEFVQVIHPRNDFDPKALNYNSMPFCLSYLAVADGVYVDEESGYKSMAILTPRAQTGAESVYGDSPAQEALPALGGASITKKTVLKQGQKAVDPVILAYDDGVLSGRTDLRPGKVNYGGVDAMGRKLIQTLDMGNFNVAENILADDRKDIEDSFFVTLFQILTETPEMTATEVMERVAEKAALLAPTMGRLQSEFLGPLIEREISLLVDMGELPEMPPELVEAKGEYEITYTSPLAKGMYAEETSGFMRLLETALNVAQQTQDPSPLDHFDLDVAIPAMGENMSVRTGWMRSPDKIEALRKAREDANQAKTVTDQAPAIASVATAAMKQGATGIDKPPK